MRKVRTSEAEVGAFDAVSLRVVHSGLEPTLLQHTVSYQVWSHDGREASGRHLLHNESLDTVRAAQKLERAWLLM